MIHSTKGEVSLEYGREDNRHRTTEVFITLVSIVGIFLLLVFCLRMPQQLSMEQRAKTQARVLAYSAWQIGINRSQESSGTGIAVEHQRGLASLDQKTEHIGRDSWGRPFTYVSLDSKEMLFIWSSGANGLDESNMSLPLFKGDDIGFILDLKLKQ